MFFKASLSVPKIDGILNNPRQISIIVHTLIMKSPETDFELSCQDLPWS